MKFSHDTKLLLKCSAVLSLGALFGWYVNFAPGLLLMSFFAMLSLFLAIFSAVENYSQQQNNGVYSNNKLDTSLKECKMNPFIRSALVYAVELYISHEAAIEVHLAKPEAKKIAQDMLTAAKLLLPLLQAA